LFRWSIHKIDRDIYLTLKTGGDYIEREVLGEGRRIEGLAGDRSLELPVQGECG